MVEPTLVVELLMVAAAVALATKFVRLPYTVALVLVGLGIGISHVFHEVHLSKDLIILVFLPPLLFEGSLNMELEILREQWLMILLLAVLCTLASMLAIGFGVSAIFGLPLWTALLLGAMLAATDPVSVLAIFKELGVNRRLSLIVEGESVFNDGVAVVLFTVVLGVAEQAAGGGGAAFDLGKSAGEFLYVAAGGVGIGALCGYVAYRLHQRIDDHLLEVTLSLILAYGSFLLAERFHTSGVLATAAAGLIIGNYGRIFAMSPATRVSLHSFWEVAVFIVNSLVFLLVGIQLVVKDLWANAGVIAVTFVLMTAARAACVYGFGWALRPLKIAYPIRWLHTMALSGIRGSVPVALALGLAPDFPGRGTLMSVTFGVVLFSLVVQGFASSRLIQRLGLSVLSPQEREFEEKMGRALALKAGLRAIDDLGAEAQVPRAVLDSIAVELSAEKERLSAEIGRMMEQHDFLQAGQALRVRRRVLLAQKAALADAIRRGTISESCFHHLVREVDGALTELETPHGAAATGSAGAIAAGAFPAGRTPPAPGAGDLPS